MMYTGTEMGMLYLCATPIGNLEDITFRVVRTLKEVDMIAAEDTRNSIKLLNHFDIHTPMTSYHEHNKYDKAEYLISLMKEGRNVALITDAGTPAISDPGQVLVSRAAQEGIAVTSLPGAAACITALTLSGLDTTAFCFEGFLSRDKKKRNEVMERLKKESRTMILYEAPHHLKKTLELLSDSLGADRRMALCRELTKKHEEVYRVTIGECLERYRDEEPRGECVLVIEGADTVRQAEEKARLYLDMSLEEHISLYLDGGMDKKEAMKKVAADRGVSKREVYAGLLRAKSGSSIEEDGNET